MPLPKYDHPLPGIVVCMAPRGAESSILESIESFSRVLNGQKWALVVAIDGDDDDTGGVIKRARVSACRVIVHQLPPAASESLRLARAFTFARFLHHEFPYCVLAPDGSVMLDDFLRLLGEMIRHGHTFMAGQIQYTEGDLGISNCPWDQIGIDGSIIHQSVLGMLSGHSPFHPGAGDDVNPATVARARIWETGTVMASDRRLVPFRFRWPVEGPGREKATARWIGANLSFSRKPGAVAYLAMGDQAHEEALLSILSLRIASKSPVRCVVATDNVDRVRGWGIEGVDTWPVDPYLVEGQMAMDRFAGNPGVRGLFSAVCAKAVIVRDVMSEYGSCIMSDSDILYLEDFGPLPAHPASAPKSFPWFTAGSYAQMHQWGVTSAGVMWFPEGSFKFVNEMNRQTLENVRLFRDGRSQTSAPGGSAFAEQDGFDMACHTWPSAPLHSGHNVTPSSFGHVSDHLSRFSGVSIVNEVERLFEFQLGGGGLWWRGFPVHSLHCHWGGRQGWNPEFETFVTDALACQPRTVRLRELVLAIGKLPARTDTPGSSGGSSPSYGPGPCR